MTEPEMLSTPEERAALRAHHAWQFAALDDATQAMLRRLAKVVAEIKAGTYPRDEPDNRVRWAQQLGALEAWADMILWCFALDEEPEEPGR